MEFHASGMLMRWPARYQLVLAAIFFSVYMVMFVITNAVFSSELEHC